MYHDCGFTKENHWFRYRAAAIIVEDGCVLLAGNDVDDYLYSVGGGVHMSETAEDAVVREVLKKPVSITRWTDWRSSMKISSRAAAVFRGCTAMSWPSISS